MVRLTEWPRNPYLNEEIHEWVRLHLDALGVDDVAVYATASGREDDERRILVVTEVGLLDGWYAPRGSTARYSLSVRLYPWQAVHGVDLRGETFRLWAHEHQSRWRLRLARPALDTVADSPELGRALTQFAAACSVMAEPAGVTEPVGPAVAETPQQPKPAASPARVAADAAQEPGQAVGMPPAAPESASEVLREAPAPQAQPRESPLEEVVATIGDVGPPRRVPPVPTESGLTAERVEEADASAGEDRAQDLARRLGLR
jgi:hypothetical protein